MEGAGLAQEGPGLPTPSLSVVLRSRLSLFLPFVPALGLIGNESFQGFSPPPPLSPAASPHPPPGCEGGQRYPVLETEGSWGWAGFS